MLKTFAAGLGVLVALLLATPSAASAYVPGEVSAGSVTGRPAPGAVLRAQFDRVFLSGETVTLVVSCPGLRDVEIDDTADGDGSTSTPLTVPAGASGTCTVSAFGVSSGAAAVASFTVLDPDAPAGEGDASGDGLAVTGGSGLAAIWFGVGAVVLGGTLFLVGRHRRVGVRS
ncbi:hypothetical protein ELQ90_14340 [Labedella phragmitis]|uniref:Sortase n=1 Tax=Labedella phragmitis TaxID=2498849 RepID=A0A444PQ99_9MICO|nr:hypothetical protein [Labedella phragmitis]RWZ46611.1 hypothetical protein ELQ90_14340 [Labedella phragmitis]